MELVQTPLGPLNVFATMDTLEMDAIVQVQYNYYHYGKSPEFFCEIVGLQRLHIQTNGPIHTRLIMTINTLTADFVVCLFVYFAKKSKRVEKKERS